MFEAVRKRFLLPIVATFMGLVACQAQAQVSVLTQRNDNSRSGANNSEVLLNQGNVNTATFGLLFSRQVDGQIYSQPLFVPQVPLANGTTMDLVIVTTENDSVYAFDADNPADSNPIWKTSFINPAAGITTVPYTDVTTFMDLHPQIGITSTPVISWNGASGTVYVTAKTKEAAAGGTYNYVWRLHALNVATGAEQSYSPVVISGSVPGKGTGSVNGTLTFQSLYQNQRTGLLLYNGVIYLGFGSHGDAGPYHGWLMAYNASTLQQVGIMADTPNGYEGGIWQAGNGLAVDQLGNILVSTGNGEFNPSDGSTGDSVLKVSPAGQGFGVVDSFTPFDQLFLDTDDDDLGSGGTVPIPGTNYVLAAGKEGYLYVLNDSALGGFNAQSNSAAVQVWFAGAGQIKSTPLVYSPNGTGSMFFSTQNDSVRSYPFSSTATVPFATTPSWQTAANTSSGAFLSSSSNSGIHGTGVIWANMGTTGSDYQTTIPGILRAYSADDLTELWNSNMVSTDSFPWFGKFVCPTVANGKVYLSAFPADNGSSPGLLLCYGLKPWSGVPQTPKKSAASAGINCVDLSWGATPGAITYTVYRSTGSTGPFTALVSGVPVCTYVDNAVTDGTEYYYCIAADNSAGESPQANIVHAAPDSTAPLYRVNCGGAAVSAESFTADAYFAGGATASTTAAISAVPSAAETPIFQSARTGTFSYRLFGLVPSMTYQVTLYFADFQCTAVGQRLIDVYINGTEEYSALDLVKHVGASTAYSHQFNVNPAADGTINISLNPHKNSPVQAAILNGIELRGPTLLVPDVEPVTATNSFGRVLLSWPGIATATSYNLYRGTASGQETLYMPGLHGTSYTDYGALQNSNYYYYVTAVNPNGQGAPGPEAVGVASSMTLGVTPQTPTLSVSQGTSQITVSIAGAAHVTDSAALRVSGLPSGVTATFSSTAVTESNSVTLTLTAAPSAALQSTTFTLTATCGINSTSTVVPLIVTS